MHTRMVTDSQMTTRTTSINNFPEYYEVKAAIKSLARAISQNHSQYPTPIQEIREQAFDVLKPLVPRLFSLYFSEMTIPTSKHPKLVNQCLSLFKHLIHTSIIPFNSILPLLPLDHPQFTRIVIDTRCRPFSEGCTPLLCEITIKYSPLHQEGWDEQIELQLHNKHQNESPSMLNTLQEPFLHFDVNSRLSFEDTSRVYCSLVALVKAEYPFDNALQDKAVQFLKGLEPKRGEFGLTVKLVIDLVPSSDESPSGFVDSLLTLLSSSHSTVIVAVLSFLNKTITLSSSEIRSSLVELHLISNVFVIIQPHTLSISGNEEILDNLIKIIDNCLDLADPAYLTFLGITAAAEQSNYCEMIFQKTVIPSSQFVTFLISNRYVLYGDLFRSFMALLSILIRICPFHRQTLEFVLASPIAMTFSSCLSFFEDNYRLWVPLINVNNSLGDWKKYGPEVALSGKRMMRALFSESFKDTLEQISMYDKGSYNGLKIVKYCHTLSQLLGSNVEITED
ncbi:hypothetical protein BLNAU_16245 [Blattamonas nauphoetae]|uniref:Uncharacterized protein n=1 Tax=Blattamonas nauphoetae TaxID=2049346 RepID=A0ABQ9XC28_9EUKA|nr:hypothetical protein BLNAU_16245 [Blattamonas nauphoetae]